MTDEPTSCPRCGLRLAVPAPERCPRCAGLVAAPPAVDTPAEMGTLSPPKRTGKLIASAVVGAALGVAFTVVKHPELRKKHKGAHVVTADAGVASDAGVVVAAPKVAVVDAGAPAADAGVAVEVAKPVVELPTAPLSAVTLDATRVYLLAEALGGETRYPVVYEWNVASPNSWGFNTMVEAPIVRPTDGAVLYLDGVPAGQVRVMRPFTRITGERFAMPLGTPTPEQHPEGGLGCTGEAQGPQSVTAFLVAADTGEIVYNCSDAKSPRWMRKGTQLRFEGRPISLGWSGYFLTVIGGTKLGIEKGDGGSAFQSEELAAPLKADEAVAWRAVEDGFLVAFLQPSASGTAGVLDASVLRVDFRANLRPMPYKYAPVPIAKNGHRGALVTFGDLVLMERASETEPGVAKILRYPQGGGPPEPGLSDVAATQEGPHLAPTGRLFTGP
jgi:hypothetical protein